MIHLTIDEYEELVRAAENGDTLRARVTELEALIRDDGFAMTFQSLGQYRSALILSGKVNHA